jgi:hypothetical protein
MSDDQTAVDPILGLAAQIRLVHPYQARKAYRCPSCGHAIAAGTGHYVVVPIEAPDLRRHWHRSCWDRQRAAAG